MIQTTNDILPAMEIFFSPTTRTLHVVRIGPRIQKFFYTYSEAKAYCKASGISVRKIKTIEP